MTDAEVFIGLDCNDCDGLFRSPLFEGTCDLFGLDRFEELVAVSLGMATTVHQSPPLA